MSATNKSTLLQFIGKTLFPRCHPGQQQQNAKVFFWTLTTCLGICTLIMLVTWITRLVEWFDNFTPLAS